MTYVGEDEAFQPLRRRSMWWMVPGPILGLLAFGVYFSTLTDELPIGQFEKSAQLIAQHTGISPFATTDSPLWGMCARLIAGLPWGALALKFSVFSAVCGALAVWLLYNIVSLAVRRIAESDDTSSPYASIVSTLAGVCAAAFLAFCPPFWYVSNRAHTAAFDVLLLLIAGRIFLSYYSTGARPAALLFAFVYGMGTSEFATFLVLGPIFAGYLMYRAAVTQTLRPGFMLQIALCFLIGTWPYFAGAWHFYCSPAFAYSTFQGYPRILSYMLGQQYSLIAHSLPAIGWIVILLVTFVPWVAALLASRRALVGDFDWGLHLLHIVLTGTCVAVLIDNAHLAPWQRLGTVRLLVTPYVMTAWAFGYLVASWMTLLLTLQAKEDTSLKTWLRRIAASLVAIAGLAGVAIVPFNNLPKADARDHRGLSTFVQGVLDGMQGRSHLLTDGHFDNNLLVAARERSIAITLLDLNRSNSGSYMKYIESLFENPRLKSLSSLGMMPLLQEWLRSDPDIEQKLAILNAPDHWLSAGFEPVPSRTVFLGVKDRTKCDAGQLLADHEDFWCTSVPPLKEMALSHSPTAPIAAYFVRHIGRVANNVGVFMQDLGRTNDAYTAYVHAREIDPENVSAALNLCLMIDRGFTCDRAAAIRKDMKALADDPRRRLQMWSLASTYGYVWMPGAFSQLGWAWAMSGNRSMSVASLKKALELSKGAATGTRRLLADIYLDQNSDVEGDALYRQMLADNPRNVAAMLTLARLSARKGDETAANELITRAEKAGCDKAQLVIAKGIVLAQVGKTGEARQTLEAFLDSNPTASLAWAVLSEVLISQNDGDAMRKCAARLEKLEARDLITTLAMARIATVEGQLSQARIYYGRALGMRPASLPILESLLELDVAERKRSEADNHVKQILRVDPDNAFGNYILGTFQFDRREYALAEDSFRRSIAKKRSAEAMNDLAWTLQKRSRYDEALRYAMEAVRVNEKSGHSWDTLGVIYMQLGQFDESEKALLTARELAADNAEIPSHIAELYDKTGRRDQALELVKSLLARGDKLPRDLHESLRALRDRLQR